MKTTFFTIVLTIISAILLILSTATYGYSYFVFVAFVPFLFALRFRGSRPILLAWLFGFIYFFTGLSWMITTFSYFGGAPLYAAVALLLWVSVTGGFLFFAPFGYVAKKYQNPLLLSMVFIALEAAKSRLFFAGVPWLNLGQSQYENIAILQFVSFFGEFGLSFIIMVINILIFQIITSKKRVIPSAMLALAILIMFVPHFWRSVSPLKIDGYKNIIAIQTGYKQETKWQSLTRIKIINDINMRLMSLDRKKYDLIVLPENTYPAPALITPYIMDVLTDVAFDTPIIFGTDRAEVEDNKTYLYNSMVFMKNGVELSIYDKMHLTPFGEYFPLEFILHPIKKYFFGPGDMFTAGNKPTVFDVDGMIIAPLICYEGSFSELLNTPVAMGANIVAMISNDTWFGDNSGKIQHLAVDAVRAAEFGRAIVRSTQDGISAVILPDGSVASAFFEPEPYELEYRVPLVSQKTLYYYLGNLWIAFIIPLVYYLMKRRKKD